jgi:anti-sigma regulatory factor (Ser/Thr protein kinase)
VWLWLLAGWLPVWALFLLLLLTAHSGVSLPEAAGVALRLGVAAALLGFGVQRFAERVPWPRPFALRFVLVHLLAASVFAAAFVLLNSLIASLLEHRLVIVVGIGLGSFLVFGVWLYLIVAGVCYAVQATERLARAEAEAARAQLAALRGQLHPHFLFNALHTVVQLIPQEPRRAAQAAEQLAALLRVTVEEERDVVSLEEEWDFVERYLALERLRFGDRLRVEARLDDEARAALLPSFALQTLVENAVRHGAAPRVEATRVSVEAATADGRLTLVVRDDGGGADPGRLALADGSGQGSGLERLRDRLRALYGASAALEVDTAPGAGFTVTLTVPQEPA